MGKLLTLMAELGDMSVPAADLPAGFAVRPCRRSDTHALGHLYYAAYEPGVASATLDEAITDIRASVDDSYGDPRSAASLAIHRDDTLAATILTVCRAYDRPDGRALIGACPIDVVGRSEHDQGHGDRSA